MIGMILASRSLSRDGRGHCGRLDLPATRVFGTLRRIEPLFQINGPCPAFEAKDRLRTQTGDSHDPEKSAQSGIPRPFRTAVSSVDTVAD
jgi:hypothetical protein